jgi:hypothetical protein
MGGENRNTRRPDLGAAAIYGNVVVGQIRMPWLEQ